MSVQIEELLKLPSEERRHIAEQLLSSIDNDLDISDEDETTIKMLDERWSDYLKDKQASTFSAEEFQQKLKLRFGF